MLGSVLGQSPIHPRRGDGRPLVLTGGNGVYVHDDAGNTWIDFDNARSSVLLGHADARVAEAVAEAARGGRGTTTGWTATLDSVLDRLHRLCGGDRISLFRTGTAAVRAAVGAVRDSTGKRLVLSSGYHGYDVMWSAPPALFEPNADGIIDFLYDLEVLTRCLDREPGAVAAVVVSTDAIHLDEGWYRRLDAIARPRGVVVILDEVRTGLRHRPGLQIAGQVIPADVWVLSKGMANGHAISAVGGDATLLNSLRQTSFTSYFEPTILAAAEATLAVVETGEVQSAVLAQGDHFIAEAGSALAEAGLPIEIIGGGAMFQFVCANAVVENEFYRAAGAEFLLFYPGDHQAPSLALSGDALDESVQRFRKACKVLAGRWPDVKIDEKSRYRAAWWEMCGLGDFARTPDETSRWVDWLNQTD
ncbi:neamine transaminase / 2'-deamino-2'-hydroxyneamine transaminase / neomycin C transaminase [Amycolatopsis xylanica]|uniref:Neamine transaminase / 2'-deamino-2'-hydroxyneamine transaminase / neomycin C transaminase n=1 Tax=Amycolatopsis xylanica TaxID=589385 RepID=A0A1H3SC38_9PSEU|nr:neamine transaminase / 2'-deamino-2'-hydroxyneamine transaminase / neomycin C transaminase [Amycolatopsis xylanica]